MADPIWIVNERACAAEMRRRYWVVGTLTALLLVVGSIFPRRR